MKKSLEYLGIALICIALAGLLTLFGVNLAKLMVNSSILKTEQARRGMPAKSNAYDQALIQELRNLRFQYGQVDSSQRTVLAQTILQRAAEFSGTKLPDDLDYFIQTLENERKRP